MLALLPAEVRAAQVTLRWDYTASGASGFVLHCGPSSRSYSTRVDAGNTDSYTVTNLAAGTTTYCAVTAYDSSKSESGYSNEVRIDIPADAPSPAFRATPTSGSAPLSVAFTDLSSGKVTGWRWSFGDGTTSTVQNPSHTYANPGTYTVILTASGPGGSATATGTTPINVSAGSVPGEIILDAGQARTSFTGAWCTSAASGAYAGGSRYSCGASLDTYRWTPSFASAGTYDLYVWWTSHPNRSTRVPITIAYSGIAQTFIKNQQTGGGQWQLLGRFPFAAGTTGYVEVSDLNGQASADAVRWVPANASEIILDNGQARSSYTGVWCVSNATAAYGANSFYSCGARLDTYRWTPSLPAAGTYDVYVWWTSNVNRSTTVPITVVYQGGTRTLNKNQQTGGGQWQLLGTFSFAAGTSGYVEVSDRNGQAAADAVKWVRR